MASLKLSGLAKYARTLDRKCDKLVEELAREAADEARAHFSADVSVTSEGGTVRASGQSVVFEEFGAGARISDPFPGGADVDFEIRRGAYSDMVGGMYAATGYHHWMHDGQYYEYVTPVNGLFYGMEHARDMEDEVGRKVFQE